MPRISAKNQITIPTAALRDADLGAGDEVVIEATEPGELRVRRGVRTIEDAFGALSGTYPRDYLDQLDADDERR